MAPSQRADPPSSVEPPADSAPLLSDSQNPSNDRESSNTSHEPDMTICMVAGVWMPVPRTYDPETYDPEGRVQWTPEPEPYDPDTYSAWGRKHFGDDWYEQRRTMLQERNMYAPGQSYVRRQRDLRVMEHKIEGRPFRPRDGVLDKGWQRLWARLSKDLPSVETPGTPPSFQFNDNDNDNDPEPRLPPTPKPRVLTPEPADPWERLEWDRRTFNWDEERYQFGRVFLRECLIDKARTAREDEEGDRRARKEWEAITDLRWKNFDKYASEKAKYERRERDAELRGKGWTQEQIEAADRADAAMWEWRQENPLPRVPSIMSPPLTQEETDAYDAWLPKERAAKLRIYGELPPRTSSPTGRQSLLQIQIDKEARDAWRRNIHARVSSQHKYVT